MFTSHDTGVKMASIWNEIIAEICVVRKTKEERRYMRTVDLL